MNWDKKFHNRYIVIELSSKQTDHIYSNISYILCLDNLLCGINVAFSGRNGKLPNTKASSNFNEHYFKDRFTVNLII